MAICGATDLMLTDLHMNVGSFPPLKIVSVISSMKKKELAV